MKARFAVRGLLAGSSFVALMAASNAALAVQNAPHTTITSITVPAGDTEPEVYNFGNIINGFGDPVDFGILVNGGTVNGAIINNGTSPGAEGMIDVSGNVFAFGISVQGTSGNVGVVTSGINNFGGTINALASSGNIGSGLNAGGILVGGNGFDVSIGGDVKSSGSIDVTATNIVDPESIQSFDFDAGATAQAQITAGAGANAFGIGIFEDLATGGIENSGNISVAATATLTAAATALGNGGSGYANVVGQGAHASAGGIVFQGGVLDEGLDNSGVIDVSAAATMNTESLVSNDGAGSSSGNVYGYAESGARGISVNATISGDITNSGDLTVSGTANSGNTVDASADNGGAAAAAESYAYSYAYGMDVYTSVVGEVSNSGNISATSSAIDSNDVTATAEGDSAYAQAYATADATARGIRVRSTSVDGEIENEGTITLNATASVANTVTADSDSYAYGYAYGSGNVYAHGIEVSLPSFVGNISNSGDISITASANVNNTVSATGESTSGDAYSYGNVYGLAYGVNVQVPTLQGTVNNSGDISIALSATGSNSATVDSDTNTSAFAEASGDAYAQAYGVFVQASVSGALTNSGNVEATVSASQVNSADASATSNYGYAYAYGSADAYAAGVVFDVDSVVGNVSNSGDVDLTASASTSNTATSATDYSGNVTAAGDATGGAYALGIYADSITGSVSNTGNLTVEAVASATNVASIAPANVDNAAYAGSYAISNGGAQAWATGLYSRVYALGGSFTNTGAIDVSADATSVSSATNTASGNVSTPYAYSYAYGDASAYATGIDVWAPSVGGDILNDGDITLSATASSNVTAEANGGGSDVGAWAYGNAYATATGLDVDVRPGPFSYPSFVGDITNNGDITANVSADSIVSATSTGGQGSGYTLAYAAGEAYAAAYGANILGGVIVGDITNTGNVSLTADATSTNTASYSSDEAGGYGYSYAYGGLTAAGAGGFLISADSLTGNVANDGAITADASAAATNTASASADYYAAAYATGSVNALSVGVGVDVYSLVGSITNTGAVDVSAAATGSNSATASGNITDGGYAYAEPASVDAAARGVYVAVYALDGDVTNNGNLTADATATFTQQANVSGTDYGYAYAYGNVTASASGLDITSESLNGNILNTGDISVSATSTMTSSTSATGSGNVDSSYAESYGWSDAGATGIYADVYSLFGGLDNQGDITASASATNTGTSTASSGYYASAYGFAASDAEAEGVNVVAANVYGSIDNSGNISVTADAVTSVTSSATANDAGNVSTSAYSYAYGFADASSTALYADIYGFEGVTGSFTNSGILTADSTANLTASATVYADNYGLAATNVWADSNADGIDFNADTLGGNFTNTGDVTVSATTSLTSTALADLVINGGNISTSDAFAEAESRTVGAYANGVEVDVALVQGNILNSGDVSATASATADNSATAYAYDYAYAYAWTAAYAQAYGLEIYTDSVTGGIANTGALTVDATTTATNSATADASGTGYPYAYAYADAYSVAIGMKVEGNSLMGYLSNEGDINATATATLESNSAEASGSGTGRYGYAYAYGYSTANATGIYADHYAMGSFDNQGNITVTADAVLNSSATADSDFYAYANVQGGAQASGVGIDLTAGNVYGSVTNSGNITVNANATGNVTGEANDTTEEVAAISFAEGGAGADAVGLYVNLYAAGLTEDFNNSGDLTVDAAASQSTTSSAYSYNYAYARADADSNAYAVGLDLNISTVGGNVTNTGDVSATAESMASATALSDTVLTGGNVSSSDAFAVADGRTAYAYGRGIDINGGLLDGELYNGGSSTVDVSATSDNSSTANSYDYAYAYAYGSTYATAYGMVVNTDTITGNVTNTGDMDVSVSVDLDNEAEANGGGGNIIAAAMGNLYAYAYGLMTRSSISEDLENSGDILVSASGDAQSSADATGNGNVGALIFSGGRMLASGIWAAGSLGGDFTNSGDITASSTMTAGSHTTATSGEGAAAAYSLNYAYVNASGIYLDVYGATLNDASNSGDLDVSSIVSLYSTATADGAAAMGNVMPFGGAAIAYTGAYSGATGMFVEGNIGEGDITNTGDALVVAQAHVLSNALASSESGNVMSQSLGTANAYALGVGADFTSLTGSFVNMGDLNVSAIATSGVDAASNDGNIAGAYAGAYSYAEAYGLAVYGDSLTGSVYNSGALTVFASADAEAKSTIDGVADTTFSIGRATAIANGILVESEVVDGDVVNEDSIDATAIATANAGQDTTYAEANAVQVYGGTYTGGIINSGDLTVSAEALTSAISNGILVDGGAILNGGVVNTGDITATAIGGAEVQQANAYNIEGAGAGTTIWQAGGAINGDIRMANSNSDTFNFTGGSINGDTYGNTGDVFNVYAGDSNDLHYHGTIDSVSEINVNLPNSTTAVRFTLASHITNGTDLNVNPQGTFNLGTDTTVDVVNFNVSSTGHVNWELDADGSAGLITTQNVNLASGAGSSATLNAGLFGLDQSYTVIDSATNPNGAFNFTFGGSSLYTVTADWLSSGDDYVIHVKRKPLSETPGTTPGGSGAGSAIDQLITNRGITPNSPLGLLLGRILVLPADQVAAILNTLAGPQNAELAMAGMSQFTNLLDIIFSQLNGGAGSGNFAELNTNIRVANNSFKTVMGDAGPSYTWGGGTQYAMSAWVRGFGSWTSLDGSGGSTGFDSSGGGVIAGLDYQTSPEFLVGIAGGYMIDDLDFNGSGGGDIKSWVIAGYAKATFGQAYLDGVIGYASQEYDLDRRFTILGTNYVANRQNDGHTVQIAAEAGYDMNLEDGSVVEPFLAFTWGQTTVDGTTETGAAPFNLVLGETQIDSARTKLGARWSKTFGGTDGVKWTPTVELAWRHEFADTNATQSAAFSGFPASTFPVLGTAAPRDAAALGLGIGAKFSDCFDAALQYKGEFASGYNTNTAMLRLRLHF